MMKKKCLLLCYTDLANDPRVIKHFEALKDDYNIITAGTSPIGSEREFVKIEEYSLWENLNNNMQKHRITSMLFFFPLKVSNFLRFKIFKSFYFLRYWNIKRTYDLLKLFGKGDIDLIVANDLNTLPLAVALARKNTKLLYDAHEYHTEEYGERAFWVTYNRPLVQFLYQRYIRRADACITVGENIAKRYENDYDKPFSVIYNTPSYLSIPPTLAQDAVIKLVYSGMYGKNRNLDEVIKALEYLPSNYELHLLVTNADEDFKKLIENSPDRKRITVHKAVPVREVAAFLNGFDIGVHLMGAVNFNNDNALPNKYFQYIQARLVTAFGPLSEISIFTKQHQTGVICEGYKASDLAKAVLKLSREDINRIKENNNNNAKMFCEENEINKLKLIYEQVMA